MRREGPDISRWLDIRFTAHALPGRRHCPLDGAPTTNIRLRGHGPLTNPLLAPWLMTARAGCAVAAPPTGSLSPPLLKVQTPISYAYQRFNQRFKNSPHETYSITLTYPSDVAY